MNWLKKFIPDYIRTNGRKENPQQDALATVFSWFSPLFIPITRKQTGLKRILGNSRFPPVCFPAAAVKQDGLRKVYG